MKNNSKNRVKMAELKVEKSENTETENSTGIILHDGDYKISFTKKVQTFDNLIIKFDNLTIKNDSGIFRKANFYFVYQSKKMPLFETTAFGIFI